MSILRSDRHVLRYSLPGQRIRGSLTSISHSRITVISGGRGVLCGREQRAVRAERNRDGGPRRRRQVAVRCVAAPQEVLFAPAAQRSPMIQRHTADAAGSAAHAPTPRRKLPRAQQQRRIAPVRPAAPQSARSWQHKCLCHACVQRYMPRRSRPRRRGCRWGAGHVGKLACARWQAGSTAPVCPAALQPTMLWQCGALSRL